MFLCHERSWKVVDYLQIHVVEVFDFIAVWIKSVIGSPADQPFHARAVSVERRA